MAYVTPEGIIKIRATTFPQPQYDFVPCFSEKPLLPALRTQLVDLIVKAIRVAVSQGFSFEDAPDVDDVWRIDWGQKVHSGTERELVEEIVADMDDESLGPMLLHAFYASIHDLIDLGDDALTEMMSAHVMSSVLASDVSVMGDGTMSISIS